MDAFFDNCIGAMPDLLTKKVSVQLAAIRRWELFAS